jgi:DNA repair protein RadD
MPLYWYQSEACEAAWSHLCGQSGNPVVVLPTGAGKSWVIAELCRAAVQDYSGRVIVLAHRKELLEQNAAKIGGLLPPGVSLGLYSAGLREREVASSVVVAGIQSVYKRAEDFGERNLVLIDEVHLVPHDGEGMYRRFLGRLREINPGLRMVGLTATPYRTGEGAVCRADALFQKVCYEASIPRLIKEGFLSPVFSVPADETVDTSGLHVRGGEFVASEVETLFDSRVVLACQEIAEKTRGRRSVLVFCSGVAHAQHVATTLEMGTGERVGIVTGGTPDLERAETLARFKRGNLRFLCNVDVLTTGFDAPGIDAIALLRATLSPGLYAQMCGRGLRKAEGKADCLILDFGENIKRHGPLDSIEFGKRGSALGTAPEKICPNCGEPSHASAGQCLTCGWVYPARDIKHGTEADNTPVLSTPVTWTVEEVRFSRHRKKKGVGPDTLRVDYLCTGAGPAKTISEWVCLEHDGWARKKAHKWWRERSKAPVPDIETAISLFLRGAVASPSRITTIKEGKFWRVTKYDLDPIPEEWAEEVAEDPWEEEEAPF